jgi:hypothetical protein
MLRLISELKGGLKVHIKATDFEKAKELLHQFKGNLPPGVSMAHINIKTQSNDDWFAQHHALKLGQSLDNLSKDFDASILLYPDSDKGQVIMATCDKGSKVMISKGDSTFMANPEIPKNVLEFIEYKDPRQQVLRYEGNTFDSDIQIMIMHDGTEGVPTTEETLENLKLVSEVTQQSVSDIVIEVFENADLNHYKELIKALSDKYKVGVVARVNSDDGSYGLWLLKNPSDSEVTVRSPHLAETTPHKTTPLQNWDTLSQEQTTKLTEEMLD